MSYRSVTNVWLCNLIHGNCCLNSAFYIYFFEGTLQSNRVHNCSEHSDIISGGLIHTEFCTIFHPAKNITAANYNSNFYTFVIY